MSKKIEHRIGERLSDLPKKDLDALRNYVVEQSGKHRQTWYNMTDGCIPHAYLVVYMCKVTEMTPEELLFKPYQPFDLEAIRRNLEVIETHEKDRSEVAKV